MEGEDASSSSFDQVEIKGFYEGEMMMVRWLLLANMFAVKINRQQLPTLHPSASLALCESAELVMLNK